jgi:hypothetical protein
MPSLNDAPNVTFRPSDDHQTSASPIPGPAPYEPVPYKAVAVSRPPHATSEDTTDTTSEDTTGSTTDADDSSENVIYSEIVQIKGAQEETEGSRRNGSVRCKEWVL